MDREQVEAVVIGGGVVGLAVARALAQAGRDTLLLEAHPAVGQEASSRNSEVIHAGLYYRPGSLKARACLRGRALLLEYCRIKGVDHRVCGKLVVASSDEQVPALRALEANAAACGVEGLEWADSDRCRELEPKVRAAAGLWSAGTGIIDSHALMLSLQADIEAAGGTLACNTRVAGGRAVSDGIELVIDGQPALAVSAHAAINCGGLHAAALAARIEGLDPQYIPQVHLVRGHYFTYGGPSPLKHLVYPLPEAGGLGIHGTLDLAGQLRFGPDSEYVEKLDYAFQAERSGFFEERIRRWYPDLEEGRLQPGYTGIRPRLAGPDDGFRDFMISGPADHGLDGLVNLFGIESPGLTACLALADEVANLC